MLNFIT